MKVLLQPPLLFLLLAGLGCAVLAVAGVIEALRKFREARSRPDEAEPLGLRYLGNLAVTGILAFVAVYFFLTIGKMAPSLATTLGMVGSPAPAVTYTRFDLEASPQESVRDLAGDVVLLNVWATWCPPCRQEMPDLDRLQTDLAERGLTVLHLSFEDDATLRSWLEENPMSTRHGRTERPPFPVPALPTTLIIDREGVVRDSLVGGQSYAKFKRAVEPWL